MAIIYPFYSRASHFTFFESKQDKKSTFGKLAQTHIHRHTYTQTHAHIYEHSDCDGLYSITWCAAKHMGVNYYCYIFIHARATTIYRYTKINEKKKLCLINYLITVLFPIYRYRMLTLNLNFNLQLVSKLKIIFRKIHTNRTYTIFKFITYLLSIYQTK